MSSDTSRIPVLVAATLGGVVGVEQAGRIFPDPDVRALEDPHDELSRRTALVGVIMPFGVEGKSALAALKSLREQMPFAFIAVASADQSGAFVATAPALRYDLHTHGASMVTHVKDHVVKMLETLAVSQPTEGDAGLRCPSCRLGGFSEDQLWCHLPAYHTADDRICMTYGTCPACGLKRTKSAPARPDPLRELALCSSERGSGATAAAALPRG